MSTNPENFHAVEIFLHQTGEKCHVHRAKSTSMKKCPRMKEIWSLILSKETPKGPWYYPKKHRTVSTSTYQCQTSNDTVLIILSQNFDFCLRGTAIILSIEGKKRSDMTDAVGSFSQNVNQNIMASPTRYPFQWPASMCIIHSSVRYSFSKGWCFPQKRYTMVPWTGPSRSVLSKARFSSLKFLWCVRRSASCVSHAQAGNIKVVDT